MSLLVGLTWSHSKLTSKPIIESGPLWRGRRFVGQPRDVGSPIPCQAHGSADIGAQSSFHLPDLAGL